MEALRHRYSIYILNHGYHRSKFLLVASTFPQIRKLSAEKMHLEPLLTFNCAVCGHSARDDGSNNDETQQHVDHNPVLVLHLLIFHMHFAIDGILLQHAVRRDTMYV